ncbi:uncharacterized protein DS421_15g513940 [Arachis hypogaea]|nr:uncharacterized protein DS421_15g513940 [Arachis hypogaea]
MPVPSVGHELMRRLSTHNPTLLGVTPNMVPLLCQLDTLASRLPVSIRPHYNNSSICIIVRNRAIN